MDGKKMTLRTIIGQCREKYGSCNKYDYVRRILTALAISCMLISIFLAVYVLTGITTLKYTIITVLLLTPQIIVALLHRPPRRINNPRRPGEL